MKLDHLGVAVRSLDAAGEFFCKQLGLKELQRETVVSESVHVSFLDAGETHVELLEPAGPESPIEKFLNKRGEGIHHICLRVDDIEALVKSLRTTGVHFIEPAPRPGSRGTRVAFIHPKSAHGILLELSSAPAAPQDQK